MGGLGVSSHQYFCSFHSKNIVWLLPELAVLFLGEETKHRSAFQLSRESKAVCFLISTNYKSSQKGALIICGDGES